MSRKFGDIINNLEKQMENYIQQKADINSFGKVIAIGDGVARVFGLSDVQAGDYFLKKNYDFRGEKNLSLWQTKRETGPVFRFVSVTRHRTVHSTARRGMKTASEMVLRLFANSRGSYPLASRGILSAMADKVRNEAEPFDHALDQLENAVRFSKNTPEVYKGHIQEALRCLGDLWRQGKVTNVGNQWFVNRLLHRKEVDYLVKSGISFPQQTTTYLPDGPLSGVSGETNVFIIMQPLRDIDPRKYGLIEMLEIDPMQKPEAFVPVTDTVGFSGEASMGLALQAQNKEYFSLILPNDGKNYPFVDTLDAAREKERVELAYGQSKASEFSESVNAFDEKLKRIVLDKEDTRAIVNSIKEAFLRTSEDFNIPEIRDLAGQIFRAENPVEMFASALPKYSLFLSGPWDLMEPQKLLDVLPKSHLQHIISKHYQFLHGPSLLGQAPEISITQNQILSDRKISKDNHILCAQAIKSVSALEIWARSTGNWELYHNLVHASAIDKNLLPNAPA